MDPLKFYLDGLQPASNYDLNLRLVSPDSATLASDLSQPHLIAYNRGQMSRDKSPPCPPSYTCIGMPYTVIRFGLWAPADSAPKPTPTPTPLSPAPCIPNMYTQHSQSSGECSYPIYSSHWTWEFHSDLASSPISMKETLYCKQYISWLIGSNFHFDLLTHHLKDTTNLSIWILSKMCHEMHQIP